MTAVYIVGTLGGWLLAVRLVIALWSAWDRAGRTPGWYR